MKNFINYDSTTFEIISSGICADEQYSIQQLPGCELIEGIGTNSTAYVRDNTIVYYSAEQAQVKSDKPAYPCTWSNVTFNWVDSRSEEEKYNNASTRVQITRDQLLSGSDWIVIRAVDKGEPIPTDWQTYRQQLRDVTKQEGYPFNVIWPTQPT